MHVYCARLIRLIWHSRGSVSGRNNGTNGSSRDQNAEFWAQAASSLTSDIVAESILGRASVQFRGEYNGLCGILIGGVNFNNPFDPNNAQAVGSAGFSKTPSASISPATRAI